LGVNAPGEWDRKGSRERKEEGIGEGGRKRRGIDRNEKFLFQALVSTVNCHAASEAKMGNSSAIQRPG